MSTRFWADASTGFGELTPDSPLSQLVDVCREDLDLEGMLAESTRALYQRNMRQLVMPAFENFLLREISVRDTARLHKPPSQTMVLTLEQVDAIRAAVRSWRRARGTPGPPLDGQLEQIIEVMLDTSARFGEVLAIRKCDVDVTVSLATVRICGTIVSPAGKPTYRQAHPKAEKSTRVVSVPGFAAEVLRQPLVLVGHEAPDHLLFFTRNGTPPTTNSIRRRLRAVLSEAGIESVTRRPSAARSRPFSTGPVGRISLPNCSVTPRRRTPRSTTSNLTRRSIR